MASKISTFLVLFLIAASGAPALVFAEGEAAVPATGAALGGAPVGARPSTIETLVPFLLMFGVMYLLILRPQQKRMKEQQSMIAALVEGDEVVTTSGILGKIAELSEKVITLEIAPNVRVKVVRSQVSQKIKNGQIEESKT